MNAITSSLDGIALPLPEILSKHLPTALSWLDMLRHDAQGWYSLLGGFAALLLLVLLAFVSFVRRRRQRRLQAGRQAMAEAMTQASAAAVQASPGTVSADPVQAPVVLPIKQAISSIYSVMPVAADSYDAAIVRAEPVPPARQPLLAEPGMATAVHVAAPPGATPAMPAHVASDTHTATVASAFSSTTETPTVSVSAEEPSSFQVQLQSQQRLLRELQQQIKIQSSALLIQGQRLLAVESALEQVDQRQQRFEEERNRLENYDEAIALAASGIDSDSLRQRFNLSPSEAELITLLHGKRSS